MRVKTTTELNAHYGFFPLPSEISLRHPFATTAEFCSFARNHCCAVMTVNLLLQKFPAYCAGFSRRELFLAVHAFVGNGPILTLRRVNRFLQNTGLTGRFVRVPASSLFSCSFSPVNIPGTMRFFLPLRLLIGTGFSPFLYPSIFTPVSLSSPAGIPPVSISGSRIAAPVFFLFGNLRLDFGLISYYDLNSYDFRPFCFRAGL